MSESRVLYVNATNHEWVAACTDKTVEEVQQNYESALLNGTVLSVHCYKTDEEIDELVEKFAQEGKLL